MLSVEVGGLVVLVKHADHDAKERRDNRHASTYSGVRPRSVQHCAKLRGSIRAVPRQLERFVRLHRAHAAPRTQLLWWLDVTHDRVVKRRREPLPLLLH